ncbi:MAG TPA: EF-Tu/IF-2/RF-3 family GTPase [Syntrophorhabdaceae bacterium]|nr:EF-Tu/IF-2/RF-3 family GTPase [Syntrophorhabdaceae bacterium]HOL04775.1 EF-Tu/IF-2/RF-3 family GTPase [Syntrophorhabdaceae bacterium]HON85614.1 EF-Tu/IF-2/RF-3 family GTPase [Syntrophorhabdaceae bacterium]HPC65874.1 EF-Tu/IF-2/RF-3 family GTPase [Syntrophorhabdaceae bacterium]HPP40897.1 EF-Tu/IF-2/RF-3 family GTPase [Syntrophorhabdaceae bacterium]
MEEKEIGRVMRYFSKIGVAAIRITDGELKVGDRIRIKGSSTDFEQVVESMQIEHEFVEKAEAGKDVGIKVKEKVRDNDKIYLTG